MLILISPAKTLNFEPYKLNVQTTIPDFLDQSQQLITILKKHSVDDIRKLMGVSDKIAELNAERFRHYETPFTNDNAKPAIITFKGDVYEGLNANDFSDEDFAFAQDHLRMLSGLYGLLRPLDLMQPYRLEMGTKLENAKGKNLYEFWGKSLTEKINETEDKLVVNLASNEYFSVIKLKQLKAELITVNFKEWKNGQYKIVGIYAKKARGLMSRFIIKNRIIDKAKMKDFTDNSYAFNEELSSDSEYIFTRTL
jgi:cytoplasmic iron level regulating protein YaaA (DUF328/UPF0246 family)